MTRRPKSSTTAAFVLALHAVFVLLAGAALAAAPLGPPAADEDQKAPEPIYDTSADAKQQIADAMASARKENRRVLIQWGANWCGWCHLLHDLCASDRDIARKLMYEYDVVLVDIGRWDKNLDLAESYGADIKKNGVPFLTIVDPYNGEVVVNQETGSLELKGADEPAHDPEKVLKFLTDHQPDYQDANKVLRLGMKRANADHKYVFLHFGAPWCGWCHELEDWMAQPEINSILDKRYVDVKIDVDRTINGKSVFNTYTNGRNTGIPWFAIVNPATGKVIADSSGDGDSNIGYPVVDEEINRFRAMLETGDRQLSQPDIDTLIESLRRNAKKIRGARSSSADG